MSTVDIRFGGYQPARSVHNRAGAILGRDLATRLGDDLSFDQIENVIDLGHNAADLLTMVGSGEMTMCYFSSSYLADKVPEFALLDLPFTIRDRTAGYALLDGPLGALLADRLRAATDFHLLGFWDNGIRHLSNRARPIHTPDDCRGLRIRTLLSEVHQETFRAFGFEPVPLDVKDLIAGVRDGTIDAQDNPLTNIFNFGIHEFHPHITLTGHFFGVAALLCHQATYDSWPEDIRAAIAESVSVATTAQRGFAAAEDDEVSAKLAPLDVQIVTPTPAELGSFADAAAPVIESQRAALDVSLLALLP